MESNGIIFSLFVVSDIIVDKLGNISSSIFVESGSIIGSLVSVSYCNEGNKESDIIVDSSFFMQ